MASTPQDFTSGQVLTDTNMDKLPQGIMAVATVTSNVGPTSSTTELDVVTAAAVTPLQSNRRYRLRFHCRGATATVVNDTFVFRIKEGATVLNDLNWVPFATAITHVPDFEAIVDSPTAASHTYKVTITRATGTGTATVGATATAPITLTVEDAGQA